MDEFVRLMLIGGVWAVGGFAVLLAAMRLALLIPAVKRFLWSSSPRRWALPRLAVPRAEPVGARVRETAGV